MEWFKPSVFAASLLYSFVGVAVFWICFVVLDLLTPFKLWEELVEKQNRALATVVAAMCLGIAIIVAAAIH
jgi:uncharacterized membrane protein YjfL (UPF0719 family)